MGRYTGKKCRLISMFGLTGGFFLVEIVVGYVTNSMALVADSFHMLSDIAALVIAYLSVRMAPKSWDKNTYGWARAEVLGALVNAVFLVALCFSITVESLKRFYEPEDIHNPQMILLVGALGLVVNLLGLCLFHEHGHSHGGGGHGHSHGAGKKEGKKEAHHHRHHGHGAHSHLADMADAVDGGESDSDIDLVVNRRALDAFPSLESGGGGGGGGGGGEDQMDSNGAAKKSGGHGHSHSASQMNMRGVFLHVLADALGSVVVIVSALIMWLSDWEYKKYVDPALSLCLVMLMLRSVWPLLIESALILLQTVPTHIEVDTLKKKLLENVDGVLAVHEFHVWQLTGERIIASAHIRCFNLTEYMKVAENIKEFFHNEGIHSTTIQPEFLEYHPGRDYLRGDDCILSCPKGGEGEGEAQSCDASKCCRNADEQIRSSYPNLYSMNSKKRASKKEKKEAEKKMKKIKKQNGVAVNSFAWSKPQQNKTRSDQNTPLAARRQSAVGGGGGGGGSGAEVALRRGSMRQQQQQQQQSPFLHTSTPNPKAAAAANNRGSARTPNRRSAPDITAELDLSNEFQTPNKSSAAAASSSHARQQQQRQQQQLRRSGSAGRAPFGRTSSADDSSNSGGVGGGGVGAGTRNNGTSRTLVFGSPNPPPPPPPSYSSVIKSPLRGSQNHSHHNSSSPARRGVHKSPSRQTAAVTSPSRGNNFTSDFTSINLGDSLNGGSSHSNSSSPSVNSGENVDDDNSYENSPMFCSPRSNTRVVRIISKQSNV